MVMEVYDETMIESMKYYHSGADMPFNFRLLQSMAPSCGGICIHKDVSAWMLLMPRDKWPNFVLSNHDNHRVASKKGPEYADALNLLLLTLPGTPTTYQGEEMAMRDVLVTFEESVDPWGLNFGPERFHLFTRDPCRSPIQWNDELNAGFSTAQKTWLPVGSDYKTRNMEAQKKDPSGRSSIQMYKAAADLRNQPAFLNNDIDYCVVTEEIFSYTRFGPEESYMVAINVGNNTSTEDYTYCASSHINSGAVVLTTPTSTLRENDKVDLAKISLSPGEGIVVRLASMRDEL